MAKMNKRYFLMLLGSIFFFSCTKSPENIMKNNLTKYMKEKYLLIPDSYKPARFEIKDTIYVQNILYEIDSLNQLIGKEEKSLESYNIKLNKLQNAYQHNQYHNLPKLREFIKIRDESVAWISLTTKQINSLSDLLMKKNDRSWAGRNLNSKILFKVIHTYEAINRSGNNEACVSVIYFDTTYAVFRLDRIGY